MIPLQRSCRWDPPAKFIIIIINVKHKLLRTKKDVKTWPNKMMGEGSLVELLAMDRSKSSAVENIFAALLALYITYMLTEQNTGVTHNTQSCATLK